MEPGPIRKSTWRANIWIPTSSFANTDIALSCRFSELSNRSSSTFINKYKYLSAPSLSYHSTLDSTVVVCSLRSTDKSRCLHDAFDSKMCIKKRMHRTYEEKWHAMILFLTPQSLICLNYHVWWARALQILWSSPTEWNTKRCWTKLLV